MALNTSYGPSTPSDATASLQSGTIGPAFIEIDTRNQTGSSLTHNGVLESTAPDKIIQTLI
jgi:hypothetical protein